ncbi:MAG: integrase [Thiomicrospira sp.]|jgi:hypothetical protein|nr:integrase [Thiomicrospira sp.]
MSTMFTEVYTAFKKAGVPEEDAVRAAEALSNVQTASKADIAHVREDMVKLEKELIVIKWMVGLVLSGIIALILKTFF